MLCNCTTFAANIRFIAHMHIGIISQWHIFLASQHEMVKSPPPPRGFLVRHTILDEACMQVLKVDSLEAMVTRILYIDPPPKNDASYEVA